MNTPDIETPGWDVALEALLGETCATEGRSLSIADLKTLAGTHTIRLDDILDTLCQLVRHGRWVYEQPPGVPAAPDDHMCKLLRANHRLNDQQLARLAGDWRPAT